MDNRICKGRFLWIVCLSLLCVLPLCAQNKVAKAVGREQKAVQKEQKQLDKQKLLARQAAKDSLKLYKEKQTKKKLSQSAVKGAKKITKIDSVKPAVEEIDEARIFEVNEQNPAFPGGDEAYLAFLAKNIKYPETS